MRLGIFKDNRVVIVEDAMEWARVFETANRRVGKDTIGKFLVSTVFLGIERNGLWFETMVFNSDDRPGQESEQFPTMRYGIYRQAKNGHRHMVKKVRKHVNGLSL